MAAGALLRRARRNAGLSQAELATRAGVTQSVISAYESGHRQPAVPTLVALIDATGYDLVLRLRRQPSRLAQLSGPLGRRVRSRRRELAAAAAAHGVTNPRIFGSVARGQEQPGSDIDILADFPPGISLLGLGRVAEALEAIAGARVDLVPAADLKPAVRRQVEAELVPL